MNRIEWIDTLRGFCIFCIVLGHTLTYMGLGGYNSTLGSIIVTFWLPLFFFISGFFSLKRYKNPQERLKSLTTKFIQLVIPAIIFVTIFSATFKPSPFIWIHDGFGAYWFTIVLFIFIVINSVLLPLNNCKYNKIYDFILISLSFSGIIILMKLRNDSWGWNFFCLENATKYFQFYAFGLLCHKYRNKFSEALSSNKFSGGVLILLSISLLAYFGRSFENISSIIFQFNRDIAIRYLSLLTLLLYFSKIEKNRSSVLSFFNKIGRITLDIYLLHWFFLPKFEGLNHPVLSSFIIQLVISSVIAIIIIKICITVSQMIRTSQFLSKYALGAKDKIIE